MKEWFTSDLDVKSCPVSAIGDILTLPSSWCRWEEGEETEAGGGDGSISTKNIGVIWITDTWITDAI